MRSHTHTTSLDTTCLVLCCCVCLPQVVFSAISTIACVYVLFILGHAHRVLSADGTYESATLKAITPLVRPGRLSGQGASQQGARGEALHCVWQQPVAGGACE